MQTNFVAEFIAGRNYSKPSEEDYLPGLQGHLYSKLNVFSQKNPNWGRVCAIPVSAADVALSLLKMPLSIIENAALVPINLVGAALSVCNFKNSCSLKDSLICTEKTLILVSTTPVAIFMALPKLVFQFSAIVIAPETVKPFSRVRLESYAGGISKTGQDKLYSSLNQFSISHPNWGRVCAIPVSIADIALDTLRIPLMVIESAARSVINLIGAVLSFGCVFKNSYTLRGSLAYAGVALNFAVSTPISIFMALPKLAFQFFAIVIDPKTVQSINYQSSTYKATAPIQV
jgi:hypothetical protein